MKWNSPLRLAPFKQYMLADDTRRYPMTCHMRFWFEGRFKRDLFESAWRRALARHPLLNARLVRKTLLGSTRLYWQLHASDPSMSLDFQPDAVPVDYAAVTGEELAIRGMVRQGSERALLVVKFHHAVCDGIGIFQFLEDLVALYDAVSRGREARLSPLDPASLKGRSRFHLRRRDWFWRARFDLQRIGKFYRVTPQALAKSRVALLGASEPHSVAACGAAQRRVLPRETLEYLADRAKTLGGTVNDLLLAEFFACLHEHNSAHAPRGAQGKAIRVSVPVSLRLPKDKLMPAANNVSMVFLDRRARDLGDFKALVAGIAAEMRTIKERRLGLALIRVVGWMAPFYRLLRLFMRLPLCNATAVLTNLGRPFAESPLLGPDGLLRAGDMTLVGLDTMPPVRHKTSASISVNGYGGSLSVTLRYDSTHFSEATARHLLHAYCSRLTACPISDQSSRPYAADFTGSMPW